MTTIGIIGGSGLYEIEDLENVKYEEIVTPWGKPSDKLVTGTINNTKMVFLPRHGRGHKIMPSDINYRANIFAMKMLEVDSIISVSAVGSMKPDILPGDVVIPDQFIDFTKKRNSSFFGDGLVAHVSMADPVCSYLSEKLYRVVESLDARVHKGGTYICIEGPQFSSRSESNLYRSWGVDVIGMTNMPEAKLAKEAEICYSSLALSTDYDCWHEGHDDVSVEDVISVLKQNTELAKQVVKKAAGVIEFDRTCKCSNALENSIITSRNSITEEIKNRYNILINKYIK